MDFYGFSIYHRTVNLHNHLMTSWKKNTATASCRDVNILGAARITVVDKKFKVCKKTYNVFENQLSSRRGTCQYNSF